MLGYKPQKRASGDSFSLARIHFLKAPQHSQITSSHEEQIFKHVSLGDSSHPITTASLSLALLLHFISSIFFSTQGFKAPLQHNWAIRAENQRVDFKLEQSMAAHCDICQVQLRSLQGGNTLTPVLLLEPSSAEEENTLCRAPPAGNSHPPGLSRFHPTAFP